MIRGARESKAKRAVIGAAFLMVVGAAAFVCGLCWSTLGNAAERKNSQVRYPDRTELDFEGLQIEGEIRNPGEFYFQHRREEKFDSLVKRRKNFHREMLRDAVMSR